MHIYSFYFIPYEGSLKFNQYLLRIIHSFFLYKCIMKENDLAVYSKTCLKQPLKNRQNKDLNDKW